MKKIILIISLFFSFTLNIYASTYYGEYKYIGFLEQELSDEIKYEEIKLFNTYRIEYKDLGYLEENDKYIKDENDYKEEITYQEEYDNNLNELVIIPTKNFNNFSLRLSNISVGTKIYEIELYYNNEKIKYTLGYDFINKYYRINDNLFLEYAISSNNNAYIYFDTNILFDIHNLKIVLYTPELNNSSFNINLNNKSINVKLNNNKKHEYIFRDIENIEYKYSNKIKLYRYYEEVLVKNDIYVPSGDNLILDDYKYIKKYYKRDKLVLSDENIFSEYINPKSLIDYSSDKVDIDCNINYQKNGIYKCVYKLNDIEVEKNIEINRKLDESKEIIKEEKNNEIKEVIKKEKLNEVNNNEKTVVYKSTINNKNTKEEEKINIKDVTETKKKEYKILEESKENKRNYLEKIFKYLIIIFVLFIEILLFMKKKRKNVEKV